MDMEYSTFDDTVCCHYEPTISHRITTNNTIQCMYFMSDNG